MEVPLEAVAGAAVGLVVLPAAILAARQGHARWLALGDELGFRPAPALVERRLAWLQEVPVLHGRAGRFEAQLRTYETGAGSHRVRWTALEVPLEGVDPGFRLHLAREGLGARLAKAAGGQDVQVGEPAFDAAFRVRGSDEARVRAALHPYVQQGLLGLRKPAEVALEGAVRLADGSWLPAEALGRVVHVVNAASLPLAGRDAARARQALEAQAREPGVALLRCVWKGSRRDAHELRGALQALGALADALERAAPRPGARPGD